ncbi:MAG: helix-turn-helix domain-containing protein [Saccharothrix sp.]|nr:helix-turn-helix domain-containing protein [Saccharothrix sp.]
MSRGSLLPARYHIDHVADFRATLRVLDLGAVQVHSVVVPAVQATRTRRLIRQSDPEHCHIMLVDRGKHGFVQTDRHSRGHPGDLLVYDTSHPFEARFEADDSPVPVCGATQIQFPRALLPDPTALDKLLGARLPRQGGIRNLLTAFLLELTAPTTEHGAAASAHLAEAAVDLVAALLAHETDTIGRLEPETRQRILLTRLRDHIERNLRDPALSPATIASALYISTRYLHKIFHATGTSVADWIRTRRLQRCHRDLADPRHDHSSVRTIAASWGFADGPHFNRLFHRTYGVPPGQFRRMARSSR